MWPWEHVLFAYVCYSLAVHYRSGRPPGDRAAVALAGGALFPDVIDKPLAWQFGVLETGWGPAHSVFVAVPLSLSAIAVARRHGAGSVGAAFAVGHLLHLPGDGLSASLGRGRPYLAPVLWPVGDPVVKAPPASLLGGLHGHLVEYAAQLCALDLTAMLAIQLGSVVAGGLLWLVDGRPGVSLLAGVVRRVESGRRPA